MAATFSKDEEMKVEPSKKKDAPEEETKEAPKACTHGPREKCLNCLVADPKEAIKVEHKCLHGPHEKCLNCLVIDPKQALMVER